MAPEENFIFKLLRELLQREGSPGGLIRDGKVPLIITLFPEWGQQLQLMMGTGYPKTLLSLSPASGPAPHLWFPSGFHLSR